MNQSRHVRCRWCGLVLPAWLPIPQVPEASILLYHLGTHHRTEAKPYFTRMEIECLSTVLMELFERVATPPPVDRTPPGV